MERDKKQSETGWEREAKGERERERERESMSEMCEYKSTPGVQQYVEHTVIIFLSSKLTLPLRYHPIVHLH